jgi:hypothetical protein
MGVQPGSGWVGLGWVQVQVRVQVRVRVCRAAYKGNQPQTDRQTDRQTEVRAPLTRPQEALNRPPPSGVRPPRWICLPPLNPDGRTDGRTAHYPPALAPPRLRLSSSSDPNFTPRLHFGSFALYMLCVVRSAKLQYFHPPAPETHSPSTVPSTSPPFVVQLHAA